MSLERAYEHLHAALTNIACREPVAGSLDRYAEMVLEEADALLASPAASSTPQGEALPFQEWSKRDWAATPPPATGTLREVVEELGEVVGSVLTHGVHMNQATCPCSNCRVRRAWDKVARALRAEAQAASGDATGGGEK